MKKEEIMENKRKWLEICLYVSAILVLAATCICVYKDRDNIKNYYLEKQSKVIQKQEEKQTFSELFEGKGTERNPYEIADMEDLLNIHLVLSKGLNCEKIYFKQTQDIDLGGEKNWQPISSSTEENYFTGVYDGGGHTISNLILDKDKTSLFGTISGIIKNLCVKDVSILADHCSVIANRVVKDKHLNILNCLVMDVKWEDDTRANSTFITNATRSTLAHCMTDGKLPMIYKAAENTASISYCWSTNTLYNRRKAVSVQEYNNTILEEFNQDVIELKNNSLDTMASIKMFGTYNDVLNDNKDGIVFADTTKRVLNEELLINYHKFYRNLVIYAVLFGVGIILAYIVAIKLKLNLQKTIIYVLLSICAIVTFGYGFLTHGESIIALLYDGKYEGRLKVFTDFYDCVRPGFNPYIMGDNGITTIYPPLITLVFAVLGRFIPQRELVNSIIAKDSQMGSVILAICIALTAILFYNMVMKYKQGKRFEKLYLLCLICTTYPMLHCIERGNVAIICAICITIFLYGYRSESYWKRNLALIKGTLH